MNFDEISHPSHYNQSPLQPIDVIEAWELNYNLGNVIKYIARHKHKGTPIKDLKKALWYLDREISNQKQFVVSENYKAKNRSPHAQHVIREWNLNYFLGTVVKNISKYSATITDATCQYCWPLLLGEAQYYMCIAITDMGKSCFETSCEQ